MAQLALFRTPAVAEQIFPFAVLFGSMAALLQLSRKLELVVARAAGDLGLAVPAARPARRARDRRPVGRRLQPALGLPEAEGDRDRGADLRQERSSSPRARTSGSARSSLDGQAIIRAETAVERTTTIARRDASSPSTRPAAFQERIEAAEATLRDGYWELTDARVLSADDAAAELRQLSPRLEPRPVAGAPDLHAAGIGAVLGASTRRSSGPSGPASTPPATGCSTTC